MLAFGVRLIFLKTGKDN